MRCLFRSRTILALAIFFAFSQGSKTVYAQADVQAALSVDENGGTVALGDNFEDAKKACPPPEGAMIMGAYDFRIFKREGWTWQGQGRPFQFLELSAKDGVVVGIHRVLEMADATVSKAMIEDTIKRDGAPTNQAEGKTAAIYVWEVAPYAHFLLLTYQQDPGGFGPIATDFIGSQNELSRFNFRVGDQENFIKGVDATTEMVRKLNEEERKKHQ